MTVAAVPRELMHFLLLPADQQAQVIRRMAAAGWSDQGLAAATRLSVEQIRRLLTGDEQIRSSSAHFTPPAKCARTGIPANVCTCIGPHP
jgi:hypothetical protein